MTKTNKFLALLFFVCCSAVNAQAHGSEGGAGNDTDHSGSVSADKSGDSIGKICDENTCY